MDQGFVSVSGECTPAQAIPEEAKAKAAADEDYEACARLRDEIAELKAELDDPAAGEAAAAAAAQVLVPPVRPSGRAWSGSRLTGLRGIKASTTASSARSTVCPSLELLKSDRTNAGLPTRPGCADPGEEGA